MRLRSIGLCEHLALSQAISAANSFHRLAVMALGGTIRGRKTTLRLPVEADLETYNRWMADMRVRRAHSVWHEPAMPATWKERFKEAARDRMGVVWSIDAAGRLLGFAAGSFWSVTEPGFTVRQFLIDPAEW